MIKAWSVPRAIWSSFWFSVQFRSSCSQVSYRIAVLNFRKIFTKVPEVLGSSRTAFPKKELNRRIFPGEFWDIFQSRLFIKHLRATTSVWFEVFSTLSWSSSTVFNIKITKIFISSDMCMCVFVLLRSWFPSRGGRTWVSSFECKNWPSWFYGLKSPIERKSALIQKPWVQCLSSAWNSWKDKNGLGINAVIAYLYWQ